MLTIAIKFKFSLCRCYDFNKYFYFQKSYIEISIDVKCIPIILSVVSVTINFISAFRNSFFTADSSWKYFCYDNSELLEDVYEAGRETKKKKHKKTNEIKKSKRNKKTKRNQNAQKK